MTLSFQGKEVISGFESMTNRLPRRNFSAVSRHTTWLCQKVLESLAELRESRKFLTKSKYLWAVMPKWYFKLKDLNLTHLF